MNRLGIKFDENLKWTKQIQHTISESNKVLHGIRIISKFFNYDERKDLLTSLYFSKLYYGAEVWHLPNLTLPLKKQLKKASANALRMCTDKVNIFSTHTQIHKVTGRAMPDEFTMYRHAILMYKLFNYQEPINEHLHANFQLVDNPRLTKIVFRRSQNLECGKNILLNCFVELNNLIEKEWMNLSLDSFKIKCKALL
jgi:hypothetical protein